MVKSAAQAQLKGKGSPVTALPITPKLSADGGDGARGMLEMKQAGAFNLAQDEASCVVFGMPAEAIKLGGVDQILPLERIAAEVVRRCR